MIFAKNWISQLTPADEVIQQTVYVCIHYQIVKTKNYLALIGKFMNSWNIVGNNLLPIEQDIKLAD